MSMAATLTHRRGHVTGDRHSPTLHPRWTRGGSTHLMEARPGVNRRTQTVFAARRSGRADQLLVDELVGPVAAELAAEARALEPSERQLGAVRADDVDVDHPGLDLVGDAFGLGGVGRHQ